MNEVEDLAQTLYRAADPRGVWSADDEVTRLYYRRMAQERLAAMHYKRDADFGNVSPRFAANDITNGRD